MPQLSHLKHASDFLEFVIDHQNTIFAGIEKDGYNSPAELAPDLLAARSAAEAAVVAEAERARLEEEAAVAAAAAAVADAEAAAAAKAGRIRLVEEAAAAETAAAAEAAATVASGGEEDGTEEPTGFDDMSIHSGESAINMTHTAAAVEKRPPLSIEEVSKRPIVAETWSGTSNKPPAIRGGGGEREREREREREKERVCVHAWALTRGREPGTYSTAALQQRC